MEAQPLPFTPTANPDPRNHAKPQTPCWRKPLPSWRFGLSPVMCRFAIPDDLSTPCRPVQVSGGSYRLSSRQPLRRSPGRPRAGSRLLERRHFVRGRSRSLGGVKPSPTRSLLSPSPSPGCRPSGPRAGRARQSRRCQYAPGSPPQGFPWRTSTQTPPGIGAFRPPNPPYMHCTSEIVARAVRVSEIGRCTTVFPTFKNGETKTPGWRFPGAFHA